MRLAQLAKAPHNQSVASLRKDMYTVAAARAAPATERASLRSMAAQYALLAADGCGTITAAEATPSQTAML